MKILPDSDTGKGRLSDHTLNVPRSRNPALCEQPSSSLCWSHGWPQEIPSQTILSQLWEELGSLDPTAVRWWGSEPAGFSLRLKMQRWMTPSTGTALLKHLWHIPPWQGNGTADLTALPTPSFQGFMNCQSHLGWYCYKTPAMQESCQGSSVVLGSAVSERLKGGRRLQDWCWQLFSSVCKDKIQLHRQQTHLEFGGCRTEATGKINKGKRKINQIPSKHHLYGEADTKVFKRLAEISLCCRRSSKQGQAGSAPTAGSEFIEMSSLKWVIHTYLVTVTLTLGHSSLFSACFCTRNLLCFKHSKSNKAIKICKKQRDRTGLIFPSKIL